MTEIRHALAAAAFGLGVVGIAGISHAQDTSIIDSIEGIEKDNAFHPNCFLVQLGADVAIGPEVRHAVGGPGVTNDQFHQSFIIYMWSMASGVEHPLRMFPTGTFCSGYPVLSTTVEFE